MPPIVILLLFSAVFLSPTVLHFAIANPSAPCHLIKTVHRRSAHLVSVSPTSLSPILVRSPSFAIVAFLPQKLLSNSQAWTSPPMLQQSRDLCDDSDEIARGRRTQGRGNLRDKDAVGVVIGTPYAALLREGVRRIEY